MNTFLRLLCLLAPLCLISCSDDKPAPSAPQEKAVPESPLQEEASAVDKAKDVESTVEKTATENPLQGQLNALDKAKGVQGTVDKAAAELSKEAE